MDPTPRPRDERPDAALAATPSSEPLSGTSRRRFVKSAVATFAGIQVVPRHVLGGPGFVPPSEKVNIAVVGAGGQGRSDSRRVFPLEDAQIIAVADPAESFSLENFYYRGMGGRLPLKAEIEAHYAERTPNHRCADYVDFREMMEKEKDIDAILCATPDHLHAYVSCLAMRAGKHVYCEKPLTHNIAEARHVAKVASETGVATQLGSQGHASDGTRETMEWLRAGAVGEVREIHAWVGAKRWNPGLQSVPEEGPPPPKDLHWDLWLGPREPRPYLPAYFPVAWRDFWDFGTGGIGDFGCHDLNTPVRAFDLPLPSRVEAFAAGSLDERLAPHGSVIHYTFPRNEGEEPLRLVWHDGGLRPRSFEALEGFDVPGRGLLYLGEKGILHTAGSGGTPRLFPESLADSYESPVPSLPRSPGHYEEWISACKGGPPAGSAFGYAAHLTEIALLGVLALRAGKPIEWEAEAMQAKGIPELEPLIHGSYRKGWELA